jgi:hypothetical protein
LGIGNRTSFVSGCFIIDALDDVIASSTAILNEIWDGIEWDGERALFFAFHETEEGRARNKLLDRK